MDFVTDNTAACAASALQREEPKESPRSVKSIAHVRGECEIIRTSNHTVKLLKTNRILQRIQQSSGVIQ